MKSWVSNQPELEKEELKNWSDTFDPSTGEKVRLFRKQCEYCGHCVTFMRKEKRICGWCHYYVDPTGHYEFCKKMKEIMNKNE